MKTRATNPSLWTERYESLRRHALDDRQILGSDPLGLALLVRGGIAEWMRNWTAPSPVATNVMQLRAERPVAMAPDWQRELTLVLGQMTFQHLALNV